jgi:hypothetical protein
MYLPNDIWKYHIIPYIPEQFWPVLRKINKQLRKLVTIVFKVRIYQYLVDNGYLTLLKSLNISPPREINILRLCENGDHNMLAYLVTKTHSTFEETIGKLLDLKKISRSEFLRRYPCFIPVFLWGAQNAFDTAVSLGHLDIVKLLTENKLISPPIRPMKDSIMDSAVFHTELFGYLHRHNYRLKNPHKNFDKLGSAMQTFIIETYGHCKKVLFQAIRSGNIGFLKEMVQFAKLSDSYMIKFYDPAIKSKQNIIVNWLLEINIPLPSTWLKSVAIGNNVDILDTIIHVYQQAPPSGWSYELAKHNRLEALQTIVTMGYPLEKDPRLRAIAIHLEFHDLAIWLLNMEMPIQNTTIRYIRHRSGRRNKGKKIVFRI